MIVNVEYRCPECEKVFNCPANLASHRRWHKPKDGSNPGGGKRRQIQIEEPEAEVLRKDTGSAIWPQKLSDQSDDNDEESDEGDLGCEECGKRFRKMSALRKHLLTHELVPRLGELPSSNNNTSPNSKSYSIAELLSPRKLSPPTPDLLVTPGNILSHLVTVNYWSLVTPGNWSHMATGEY